MRDWLLPIGGLAAIVGGLAWIVKGAAILATGDQPPVVFEIGVRCSRSHSSDSSSDSEIAVAGRRGSELSSPASPS